MTFAHPVPAWALVLGLVAAIALAVRTYTGLRDRVTPRQRGVLTALRALTLALIGFFLLRPVIVLPQATRTDAVVPILIDNSRSMRIADAGGQRRIDAAKSLARSVQKSLDQRFKLDVLAVGEGVSAATIDRLSPDARSSDLRAAVAAARERYRGQHLAGIVLLSDGADTGAPDLEEPLPLDVPVFAFGVGAPRIARDREVLGVSVGDPALSDSTVELAATIVSHGFSGAPAEVRVLENGRVVHLRKIAPRDDVPWTERFRVAPRQDVASVYSVELQPDAAELTPDNNKQAVLVRPPGRPRRLLLVEGAPGFEHSFIKRAWTGDRGLEVDSVVRKGRNDESQDTYYVQAGKGRADALAAGFPSRRDVLFAYDAVIFANVDAGMLTEAQTALTADFVAERGGGVLMLGSRSLAAEGLPRTPLEELIPVESSDRIGRPGRGVPMTTIFSGLGMTAHAATAADANGAAAAGVAASQPEPAAAQPELSPPQTPVPTPGAQQPAQPGTSQTTPASSPAAPSSPVQGTPSSAPSASPASPTAAGGQALGLNKVALTPEGERHPIMQLGATLEEARAQWAALPALASSTPLGEAKPGASVLAIINGSGGRARPLVAVQRYGRGRSMVFTGEASFRWRMRLPSTNHSYETFWRQAGRWLAAGASDPIALTLPPALPAGGTGRLDLDVRDAEFHGIPDARVLIRVIDPAGNAREMTTVADPVAAGRYHATFQTDQAGLFRVEADVRRGATSLGTAQDWMLVGGVDREMSDPRLNTDVLQRLAVDSGGALLSSSDVGELPRRLASAAARLASAPRLERELWQTPWTFLLVMGCIAVEWTCRRRWGLR